MGTIKQNKNLDQTWVLNSSNDTFILGKDAEIDTFEEAAIDMGEGANNNVLVLKGDVSAEATNNVVRISGDNNHVDLLLGSHISGFGANIGLNATGTDFSLNNAGGISGKSYAVSVMDYAEIVNSGLIQSSQVGIGADEGLDLTNSGRIEGDAYGVLANAEGTVVRNLKGGEITAETFGIGMSLEGTAKIVNSGLIQAQVAISDGAGTTTVINKGTLDGNVFLGAGDDIFNTRKGKFEGVADGGDGDDTYIIGKTSTVIEEAPGFGYDKVKSTASYTLGDNLEDLILQGKKDVDGTGNGGNNRIIGNGGDNVLNGMDGKDTLDGGRGNDLLFGGADQDLFVFNKKDGDDVIQDFVNGEDVIFTHFADDGPGIADLLANHAVEKNGGVMITYGEDSLFIKNMQLSQLDESDFFQGL